VRAVACAVQASAGAASDQRVALLFDPGAPFVASLFGALSAGRSYVALDPAYPVPRSRFMLEDAGATLIVCDAANEARAHELAGPEQPVLVFEQLQPPGDESSLEGGSIDDVTYVLYTSGSERAPNGVLQTHSGVPHHSLTYARAMGDVRPDHGNCERPSGPRSNPEGLCREGSPSHIFEQSRQALSEHRRFAYHYAYFIVGRSSGTFRPTRCLGTTYELAEWAPPFQPPLLRLR